MNINDATPALDLEGTWTEFAKSFRTFLGQLIKHWWMTDDLAGGNASPRWRRCSSCKNKSAVLDVMTMIREIAMVAGLYSAKCNFNFCKFLPGKFSFGRRRGGNELIFDKKLLPNYRLKKGAVVIVVFLLEMDYLIVMASGRGAWRSPGVIDVEGCSTKEIIMDFTIHFWWAPISKL